MKKTKIILSVLIFIILLITLCACTRGSGDDITTTVPPTSAEYKTEIFEEPKELEEAGRMRGGDKNKAMFEDGF